MPAIASTSGRLHSEFVRLLFLQAHRETDRFFAASGVQLAQSTSVFAPHTKACLVSVFAPHTKACHDVTGPFSVLPVPVLATGAGSRLLIRL
jgi:hypothetical protein